MDLFKYFEILQSNLKSRVSKLGLEKSLFFQQENDPKHMLPIFLRKGSSTKVPGGYIHHPDLINPIKYI